MPAARDVVLLVTTSYDVGASLVADAVFKGGGRPVRLNTDQFPSVVQITLREDGRFMLRTPTLQISSEEIRGVWYRRHASPTLPDGLDPSHAEFAERESRALLTGAILALGHEVRWVSHPAALWSSEKKPYQLRVATELGFNIPATRMTNEPSEVVTLALRGPLVAKAVSSGYISHGQTFDAIFTSEVSDGDLADLGSLSIAPVTFQAEVAKQSDVRVTVIGTEVYAAEILSQEHPSSRVDWRAMEIPELPHRRLSLPTSIQQQCRSLVSKLGLLFGAIDLILGADGAYYFIEINPNGEWVWIEDVLGYPIAENIASELLK